MLVREFIPIAQVRLSSLHLSEDVDVIKTFINMGLDELFRQFNLSIKAETVICSPDLYLYELRNKDVMLLLTVYDHDGRELQQLDVLNSGKYDFKIVNYRSFMLRKPVDGIVHAIYKASSPKIDNCDENLPIPDSMINALLDYVSYMGHSSINRDGKNEAAMYLSAFNSDCQQLMMQGYTMSLHTETAAIQARGFV